MGSPTRRLIPRDEIAAFTRAALPGAVTTYEVVHVLVVRPDVAISPVRQRPTTLDGFHSTSPSADPPTS